MHPTSATHKLSVGGAHWPRSLDLKRFFAKLAIFDPLSWQFLSAIRPEREIWKAARAAGLLREGLGPRGHVRDVGIGGKKVAARWRPWW